MFSGFGVLDKTASLSHPGNPNTRLTSCFASPPFWWLTLLWRCQRFDERMIPSWPLHLVSPKGWTLQPQELPWRRTNVAMVAFYFNAQPAVAAVQRLLQIFCAMPCSSFCISALDERIRCSTIHLIRLHMSVSLVTERVSASLSSYN